MCNRRLLGVYTGEGLIQIKDLVGKNPVIQVDSRNGERVSFASKVWCSGVKPVYKLRTKEGYSLRLTADHKVYTLNRGKIPAGELKENDKIQLLNHKGGFGKNGDRNLGLVLGWLAGDGHVDLKNAVLYFYGEKKESSEELSEAVQICPICSEWDRGTFLENVYYKSL